MVKNNLYAPFVFDFFARSIQIMDQNMDDLGDQGYVDNLNVVEVAGLRGHVIGPLTYMLMAFAYPDMLNIVVSDVENFKRSMRIIQAHTNELANDIADIIGRPEAAGLAMPEMPQETDPFKNYTLSVLQITQSMIDMCKSEIDKEGDITTGAKLARVHGAICCLSSILVCMVGITKAPDMLLTLGYEAENLGRVYSDANAYVQSNVNRISALKPKP